MILCGVGENRKLEMSGSNEKPFLPIPPKTGMPGRDRGLTLATGIENGVLPKLYTAELVTEPEVETSGVVGVTGF